MSYVYPLPGKLAFRAKGLFGYSFGPLEQKDLEVLYVESDKGHDTFIKSQDVTRIYYILSGSGFFTIDGRRQSVAPGLVVEVPVNHEYSYSGQMTLLVFCMRRGFRRKERLSFTRWNADVVGTDVPWSLETPSLWKRLIGIRILGKSVTNAFLRANSKFWSVLPKSLAERPPLTWYGHFLHSLAKIQGTRAQAFNTFFFRNRPEQELIRRVVARRKPSDTVRLAVLGCSTGAEVYSLAFTIRKARPDLKLALHAIDISREAVDFAKRGVYPLKPNVGQVQVRDCMGAGRWRVGEEGSDIVGAEIFERMTPSEMQEFFDLDDHAATVKGWIKDGITWHVGDVSSPEILAEIGPQDIVVASNFLCHMEDAQAERCLLNIARLVSSNGYIFVTGVNLDVRTKVARDLGWEPLNELVKEIHDGDSVLRNEWPCQYTALEPINTRRPDWKLRYAAAFQGKLGSDDLFAPARINTSDVPEPQTTSHA